MGEYTMNSRDFYTALGQGKLIGSRCHECGKNSVPQRKICPQCHSENAEIIEFSGNGKLVAYTVIFVPPVKMAAAGYSAKNPYCVGIVELPEGPRVSAQILNVNLENPENIQIGTSLRMATIKVGHAEEEETLLAFEPS